MSNKLKQFFAKERFKPPLVTIVQKYKADKKEGKPTHLKSDLGNWSAKFLSSLAINRLTARYIGAGAWDPKAQGAERVIKDASPVSLAISTAITSTISPHSANYLIGVEFALCAVRMWVEQKAIEKVGISGDPAGPILKPFTAGILEFGWKAAVDIPSYPQDETSRLLIAVNGIWGNIVRMAEAGLIILGYAAYYAKPYYERPKQ